MALAQETIPVPVAVDPVTVDNPSSRIPTFDLASLRSGADREALSQCLATQGVFYLTGSGVDEKTHTGAREAAVDFFLNAPQERKAALSFADSKRRRGFTGLETESTARVTGTGQYTDYSMCFSMGRDNNLFPDAKFQQVWEGYFERLHGLTKEMASMILHTANNSTLNASEEDILLEGDPILRLRLFPDVPEHRVAETEPLRMAPHYDISLITLVHQTPCRNGFVSLQCQVDGEFVDLPPHTGDRILVFCGAVATIVSDGRIKAPIHRVQAPSKDKQQGSERTSSVFFLRPKEEFEFDVDRAKSNGLNISLDTKHATFGEWMGGNYVNMRRTGEKL